MFTKYEVVYMQYCIYGHGILYNMHKKLKLVQALFICNMLKYALVNVQNAQILTFFFVQSV